MNRSVKKPLHLYTHDVTGIELRKQNETLFSQAWRDSAE